MNARLSALRLFFALPYFRGRDRIIGFLSDSFVQKPIKLGDGLRMFLDASEYVQLEILVHGATEPLTLALIRKLVAVGDSVVDVGAHIGHHALVAAQEAGSKGRVIAIDPQPYNADRIACHAVLNSLDTITTICAAAGTLDSFVSLPVQSERDRSRMSLHQAGPNDLSVSVEVPLRRLDTIFAQHSLGEVKLLKIDVEGYELEVLRGVGSRLSDCRNIILELLEGTGAERNREVVNLLSAQGSDLFDVTGKPWQGAMPLPECNIWAVRSDK